MTEPVRSITEVPMKCPLCGFECGFGDCLGDGDDSGQCPQPDCGGMMKVQRHMTLRGWSDEIH
jgi:hypothetical protein